MSYQYVIYEKKGHIAYVTINRPEVMNALHYAANVELDEIFTDFKQDDEMWVAIVTGASRVAGGSGGGVAGGLRLTRRASRPLRPGCPTP